MPGAAARYRFGEFTLQPDTNQVISESGTQSLSRRNMEVLVYLVKSRDRVVSARELLDELWPDRVVEESTIHRVISQIRTALGDSAQEQRYIRTISKRGYQAIAKVAADDLPRADATAGEQLPTAARRGRIWLVGAVICMCVVVTAALLVRSEAIPEVVTVDALRSLAVMPFEDLSLDQTAGQLVFGVTEGLLTHLSEVDTLRVASRTDATLLSNEGLMLTELAQQLKVAYVIEGSVQVDDQQTRITAQLIRAVDGFHVWSGENDIDADLARQTELSRRFAHVISARIEEDIRRTHSHLFTEFDGVDPEAVRLFLDSEEEFRAYSLGEPGDVRHALQLMERATRIDPSFAAAQQELAWNYAHRINPDIPAEEASRLAHRALARVLEDDPDSADGLFYLAQVYLLLDLDYARARQTIERGMAVFPGGRWWNYYLSRIAYREGRLQDAVRLLERSLSRDFGEERSGFLNAYATALCDTGAYQRTIEVTSDNLSLTGGGVPRAIALLLQSCAQLGLGNQEAATPLIEEAWQLAGTHIPSIFGYIFAKTGQQNRAAVALSSSPQEELRGHLATGYHALEDDDKAFALLAAGIEARDASVLELLRASPRLAGLRSDPRYAMLLQRLASMETLSGL